MPRAGIKVSKASANGTINDVPGSEAIWTRFVERRKVAVVGVLAPMYEIRNKE